MDVLGLLREAERVGGRERRDAISFLMKTARDMGCSLKMGSGKVPSLNVRFGGHGWSIVDTSVEGAFFVHLNPDSSLELSEEERNSRRAFLNDLEGMKMKSPQVMHYGQTVELLEEIPKETIVALLEHTVGNIRASLAQTAGL